jgi:branched-chain amino acid transport system substrate-binding protein
MTLQSSAVAGAMAIATFLSAAAPVMAQISGDTVRIGIITDMSGLYSDIDGQGGVEAIRMAIADFGGTVNGKKIELVHADHQNKADIAASKASTCSLPAPIPAPAWRWPRWPPRRRSH